jgi:hypothetical protein
MGVDKEGDWKHTGGDELAQDTLYTYMELS